MKTGTISWLAGEGEVGVETVRYYQRLRLLPTPPRGARGSARGRIRRYGAADAQRLRFIRSAQAAGFTLEQIRALLRLDGGCDRARARSIASERIHALTAQIAALQRSRQALRRLLRQCQAGLPGACPIIAAFEEA